MRLKKRFSLFIFAPIFLIWLAGLYAFMQSMPNEPLPYPDKKLDAIVVLTGGSNRIDEGFNLLEKDLGKKLFISGVYRGVEAKQLLQRWKSEPQKKLDCCVVLGFEAYNTAENALETIVWLKKEGFNSFYLVTSNYHMKRALAEFQYNAPEMNIQPFPIVPDKNNADTRDWWKESKTRNLMFKEYSKYIAVYFYYNFVKR